MIRVSQRKKNERGFALIGVLWLIALLSLFAAGIIALARTDTLSAHQSVSEAQAENWANAGIHYAIHALLDEHSKTNFSFDGRSQAVDIAGQPVTIAVQDELGKIDLNYASPDIVKKLLIAAKVPDAQAEKIAFSFEKKRDAFMAAPKDKAAVKLPFRTIEEIKRLPGVTDSIFRRIREALTVYAQAETPYMATAPRLVLQALPDLDPVTVEAILAERQSKKPLSTKDYRKRHGAKDETKTALAGKTFSIQAIAVVKQSAFSRRAVVRFTGDKNSPYKIMAWTSGPLEN